MQIETLKVFCDLVETGSFTQSAVINGVTQSAVSQQIGALERNFKAPLLDRQQGKGRVRLTWKGQVLYDSAKKILAVYDSLSAQMEGGPMETRGSKANAAAQFSGATRGARGEMNPDDLQI
jgi:DNA-binding transcriptional LysR family regulator